MTLHAPGFDRSVVVRSAGAEVVGRAPTEIRLLYVLEGGIQALSGSDLIDAEKGDLIVVPPGMAHAFRAARGKSADLLIVIAPGVERFEYFRKLERIAYGKEPPESLKDVQELSDTYFRDSPEWGAAGRA